MHYKSVGKDKLLVIDDIFTKFLIASFVLSMLNDKKRLSLVLCRLSSNLEWIECNLTANSKC